MHQGDERARRRARRGGAPKKNAPAPPAGADAGRGDRFRLVTEAAADCLVVLDRDLAVRYLNAYAASLSGVAAEDFIGRTVDSIFPPPIAAGFRQSVERVFASGEVVTMARRIPFPTGEIWLESRLVPLRGEDGTVREVVAYARDVSGARKAEEALRESEEKFKTLAEQSPSMIFIYDYVNRRVVYANEASVKLLGYSREEYLSPAFDFTRLCAPEAVATVREAFVRHVRDEEVPPYEYTLLTKDGRRIEALMASRLITFGGNRAILGLVTDITLRKHVEEQLRLAKDVLERQNAELRKLDRMKDGLIRDVSHELKTPVAKCFMQMELLRERLRRCCPEADADHFLEVMESCLRRQQKVISNILSIERLESGHRRYRKEVFPLDGFLREVLREYLPLAEEYGIALESDLQPGTVCSDPEMLWHVFSNILDNAVKFRAAGNNARIAVSLSWDGQGARVEVRDNGRGLSAEEQGRAFEKFYKGASSQEGSGIGLTIAHRVVEDLGGGISLESDGPGRGATVSVLLPRE